MKSGFFHKYKDLLFLFLFTILAYWPVSFMLFSVKNDAINYFLAMRYNSSEALQNGFFPYWTPYINLGYPLHGDIQSGVWNPVVFLMSLIRKFDMYWLHTEIIIINLIAGLGMYRLLQYFRFERKTVLLIACAYVLNGFITDSGQFQNWLYAAAFLPWVFRYLLKTFQSFKAKDAFGLGLAHSFMFLCGYPADTILLSYVIIIYALVSFFSKSKKTGWAKALKKHASVSIVALLTLVIACLPAILSFIEFIPLIRRGAGVPVADAMINSLAPANLISLVTPWPTMKGAAFEATDPLIRNCYMGLICLVFLTGYFFTRQKKDLNQKFLVGMLVFFLLFSFGTAGGIRLFSYHVLPLMDSFRHPANAKLFFIFAGQLLAAFAINKWLINGTVSNSRLKTIALAILSITGIAFIIALFKSSVLPLVKNAMSEGGLSFAGLIKNFRDQLSFYDLLLLNSLFVLLIIGSFYLLLRKGRLIKWIIPLACIDLFITAQFMLPLTYVKKASLSSIQSILDEQPKGYPKPALEKSLAELSKDGELYFDQIGCLNPYNKQPGRSDYIITPSNLSSQEQFWDYELFRKKITSYPLFYFADTVFATSDSLAMIADPVDRKSVLADSISTAMVRNETQTIELHNFKPNSFSFETTTTGPAFFVLLQNNYPRWKATINGNPARIFTTNLSFMGVEVPPGTNNIQFSYNAKRLGWLGLFSVLLIVSGLCYFYFFKKNKLTAV